MDRISSVLTFNNFFLLYILVVYLFYNPTDSGAIELTEGNFDATLGSKQLVIINFYANWCKFSNMLKPIFDEAADKVATSEFKNSVSMGKVDCDQESSIASRFHITKYPTLKIIINGQPAKREYRGQRSTEAFITYIEKHMEEPKEFKSIQELLSLDSTKRIVIGYFDTREQDHYKAFHRAAMNLRDDCEFYAGFGSASQQMHPPGEPIVVFRPDKDKSNEDDETFMGNLLNFEELRVWTTEKCVPLVREITFENAEELTEEGLPFLILFHHPNDKESIKKFRDVVSTHLISDKQKINFLIADGVKFAHPLHHLGKGEGDLPVIAIDSFRHMYVFSSYDDIEVPGKLKQFVEDLYSGKLHREHHYGPDPVKTGEQTEGQKQRTPPPRSTFRELLPSRNRYTLKDEL